MVKRQKEKQYQSSVEHKLNSQFRSGRSGNSNQSRPLPFDCCALTLTPFTNPVCCIITSNDDESNNKNNNVEFNLNKQSGPINHGIIFENTEIIPYLLKHRMNPINANPMTTQSLVTLNMDKIDDSESNSKHREKQNIWQCPIMNKPLMNHTKIVAIRIPPGNEANVYSYEAVQTLNFKTKNYIDLISGTKFHPKKDVIILNDVNDSKLAQLKDINNFIHLQTLRKNNQSVASGGHSGGNDNVNFSISAKRIMEKIQSSKEEKEQVESKKKQQEEKKRKQCQDANHDSDSKRDYKKMKILTSDLGITYTKGQISGSFTSTSLPSLGPSSSMNDIREATQEEILTSLFAQMKKLKRKAFVRMVTNKGDMDIELHCDIAPRTCMNFIGLIEKGWYDGKHFHRLIPNFMIQGGGSQKRENRKNEKQDKQDKSFWGSPFQDEFDPRLKHAGPGVLSMANAGPNTNNCQFFITFKTASHLDNKHSVFGKVIKGLNVLSQIEQIPTDKHDQPLEDVRIEKMVLFGDNPVAKAEELEEKRILQRIEERTKSSAERKESALGNSKGVSLSTKQPEISQQRANEASIPAIGKYLQKSITTTKKSTTHVGNNYEDPDKSDMFSAKTSRLPPPPKKTTWDFSGW